MNRNCLTSPGLIFLLIIICSCGGSPDYTRSYKVTISNEEAGEEIVTHSTDKKGNITCTSRKKVIMPGSEKDNPKTIKTQLVIPRGELFPSSYSYSSSSGVSYSMKLEKGSITRTLTRDDGQTEKNVVPYEPGMLMIDLSVFHTLEYLLKAYKLEGQKGHQVFKTLFMPSGSIEQVSILPVVDLSLTDKEYQIRVQDELDISLLADKDEHLVRMMFIKGPRISVISSEPYEKTEKP